MPTPRPIIVPSVGATLGISIAWPPRAIAQRPMTTPRIAVVIGIAIATAVPNVNSRITIAARIPSTSLAWVLGDDACCPRYPPAEVAMPARSAGAATATRFSACSSVSVSGPALSVSEM